VVIRNRSKTLIPALATYGSDFRSTGSATEIPEPGGDLHHIIKGEAGSKAYVQVSGDQKTAGEYTLTVR
jgi:hypothetical protein